MKSVVQRLAEKAKAKGMKTARERTEAEEKGQILQKIFKEKGTLDAILPTGFGLDVHQMSWKALAFTPKEVKAIADWIADHHGPQQEAPKAIDFLLSLPTMPDTALVPEGWWFLRHNEEVVCVATMSRLAKVESITTMREHRKKGQATLLLTILRKWQEPTGVLWSPIQPELRPLFERAGWVAPQETINKDGTIDFCPPQQVSGYKSLLASQKGGRIQQMDPAKSRALIERCIALTAITPPSVILKPKSPEPAREVQEVSVPQSETP